MFDRVKKLRRGISLLRQFYKDGGIKYARIAYPAYGNILNDKVVLVTGGSSGIGLAMAKKFIAAGARVVVTGRNERKLADAVRDVDSCHIQALAWDISTMAQLDEKLKLCREAFGQDIDILVNNAGVAPKKFWGDVDEEEWNRIYDTNLKGCFFLTQRLVTEWKRAKFDGYKKIINIGSQGGYVGATYPYRMVKWDIRGFTEGLGRTLIGDNIIVNGIAPGVVKTSMQEFSLQQGENLYTWQNPIHRVCLPEEIAELALFLCSDACNFIVGQTIVCDGGYTLK